jgi:thiosulfate reductase cytochrome b subunit
MVCISVASFASVTGRFGASTGISPGCGFFGINGLCYLVYGLTTGRFRERLLPIRPRDLVHTVVDTLQFKIAHEDLTVYNAVQKLLYIVAIIACINQALTGLAIWKPVQFSGLVTLFGGF